jgi:ubiquinone/menaquinone biosynthesis C-methylase UbiE
MSAVFPHFFDRTGLLRAESTAFADAVQMRVVEALAPRPGQRLLDLGCGVGGGLGLARLVGSTGEVHGVDYDAAVLACARQRALQAGLCAQVFHHHANAAALPWRSDHFDGGLCEQVLQHMHDPGAGFDEFLRVIQPGGRLVVFDDDWTTLTIDSDRPEIERRLVQFHLEQMLDSPYVPRHLHMMALERQLVDVSIQVRPAVMTDPTLTGQALQLDRLAHLAFCAGVIDIDELEDWLMGLNRAASAGSCFASWNTVVLVAAKPPGGHSRRSNLAFTELS